MGQLVTNWIRIATAGNAIDGRVIPESVITEMAELYNPDEYAARIWPDHRRWFGAWGDVVALKAEAWEGKLRLFAKLRPNSQLMQANEMDQKTFCSIEVDVKDFDGTGKHYLGGLGVTDEPGSLGTEKLKFHRDIQKSLFSQPESFFIEEVAQEEEPSAFKRVLSLFTSPKHDTSNTKDTDVEKDQFDQLMGGINGIKQKQEELENRFSTFEQQQKDSGDEGLGDDAAGNEPGTNTQGQDSEQFSKLFEAIQKIDSKQDEMADKFAKLETEKPGQRPDQSGGGDEGYMPV